MYIDLDIVHWYIFDCEVWFMVTISLLFLICLIYHSYNLYFIVISNVGLIEILIKFLFYFCLTPSVVWGCDEWM